LLNLQEIIAQFGLRAGQTAIDGQDLAVFHLRLSPFAFKVRQRPLPEHDIGLSSLGSEQESDKQAVNYGP
jgi:hypothetical protein